jgi:hypothetical protein
MDQSTSIVFQVDPTDYDLATACLKVLIQTSNLKIEGIVSYPKRLISKRRKKMRLIRKATKENPELRHLFLSRLSIEDILDRLKSENLREDETLELEFDELRESFQFSYHPLNEVATINLETHIEGITVNYHFPYQKIEMTKLFEGVLQELNKISVGNPSDDQEVMTYNHLTTI